MTLTPEREQEIRKRLEAPSYPRDPWSAKSDMQALLAEVDALRGAGDKLADATERWKNAAGVCYMEEDEGAAYDLCALALDGWREARRG